MYYLCIMKNKKKDRMVLIKTKDNSVFFTKASYKQFLKLKKYMKELQEDAFYGRR